MRNELLEPDRMKAIQEELAGFFLDHVINEAGDTMWKLISNARGL